MFFRHGDKVNYGVRLHTLSRSTRRDRSRRYGSAHHRDDAIDCIHDGTSVDDRLLDRGLRIWYEIRRVPHDTLEILQGNGHELLDRRVRSLARRPAFERAHDGSSTKRAFVRPNVVEIHEVLIEREPDDK